MRDFNTIVHPRQTWLLELLLKRICRAHAGGPTEPAEGREMTSGEGWDEDKIGLILFSLFVFLGASSLQYYGRYQETISKGHSETRDGEL
jgi:hypothetical protein